VIANYKKTKGIFATKVKRNNKNKKRTDERNKLL